MDAATVSRLEEFKKERKFYDALQFYRTKVTRSFRLKNASQVAIPLVKDALELFFSEKEYQCAIDIITQYAESLLKNNVELGDESFELLADTVAKFAFLAENEKNEENSQQNELLVVARCKLVDLSIQWTKQKSTSAAEKKYGNPRFHAILAKKLSKIDHLELAKSHFLLSDDSKSFADFLKNEYESADEEHHDQKPEVVIVEAVLQTLCLDRFPFAVALFKAFVAPSTYPFNEPLLNFQNILFDVIETENQAQYSELVSSYQTELKRSYTFIGYLTKIGKLYFGIRDNQCMPGGLGGLLSGLMGAQKEEERAVSHISSRTPARRAPVPTSSQPSPFGALGAFPPAPAPKKAAQKVEVEEDLD